MIRFNQTAGLPAEYLAGQGSFQSQNTVNTFLTKIDHRLTSNTQLTGRYNYSRNYAPNGTFTGVPPGFWTTTEPNATAAIRPW